MLEQKGNGSHISAFGTGAKVEAVVATQEPLLDVIVAGSGQPEMVSERIMKKGPMNILVTGGAGYIGSVNTAQLIEAGHRVVVFDNLSSGHKQAVHKDAVFIEGDLSNQDAVRSVIQGYGIDSVMHFAAFIEAGESMKDPARFARNNTINTLSLLETLVREGVPRFIFSSTAAIFGNPKTIPIAENAEKAPTNFYGQSKLIIEEILPWYQEIYGLSYVALRYFNASGATSTLGENHRPESHLIPLAMQAVQGKRGMLKIFGTDYPTPDGTCVRDYIHVTDLARAHLLALNALTENQGISKRFVFNLGNGKGFSVREVIDAVGRVAGKPVPIEEAPRREGDPATLIASSEKIQRELGWAPEYTDVESIIESAWKWQESHPNGYEE